MNDVIRPSNGNDEPKPPEALNAGRYAERLWGYKDQVGSYSEMGRLYEHDRANFWHVRFTEATANETRVSPAEDFWMRLLADVNTEPCRWPGLRNELRDWQRAVRDGSTSEKAKLGETFPENKNG